MNLVVFGASGKTGRVLVTQALAAGHHVTAFVREPAKLEITDSRLIVCQGNVTNRVSVERAVMGQEAVISTLGPGRSSLPNLMSTAAAHIIAAMEEQGISRLLWQTGAGIQDPRDRPSAVRTVLLFLLKVFSPTVLEDSVRAYQAIQASPLEWTVVRVPVLKDGPAAGGYRAAFVPPGPRPIARADVADFMLRQLADPTFVRQAPMIGY